MPKMQALAGLLRELDDHLAVCMRCGLCQSVCPLYAETGREADVARGKLALLDGLVKEMFKDPQGVLERLDRCLLCGSCAANCPSGVRSLDIFLKARAILAGYMGLSPAKKAVFRGLLSRPQVFNRLLALGARFQGIFVKPVDDLLGSSCARFVSPLLKGRHFRPLAPAPLHKLVPFLNTESRGGAPKAAFFVGCLIDKMFPEVGEAALKAFDAHGVGVYLPEDQGCCGIPALASGDLEAFHRLVRHNLARFESGAFDYLVTACASCAAAIRKLWPLMAQDLSQEQGAWMADLAERTLDVSQFLVEHAGLKPAAAAPDGAAPLTYHDPCHLKKSLGVASQPRALLAANPEYHLVEMPEADWCCGLGGSFSLQNYELSKAIGRRKLDHLKYSGAQVVATSCPACMLQFIDLLSQAGERLRVRHAVEIYAEGL